MENENIENSEPFEHYDLCEHIGRRSEVSGKRRCANCQAEVDEKFDKNWRDYIFPNGELDLEEMKGDLNDYWFLMGAASEVYCHVTGHRISKTNTMPSAVISEADDYTQNLIDEEVKEATEELKIKGEHFQNAFRLMFEGSDVDRRMYLMRMTRRYPELKGLSEKYPYHGSILRETSNENV